MSLARPRTAIFPLALLSLALGACGAPPEAPRLLTTHEIAAATQGSTSPPDTGALEARSASLSARANALRQGQGDAEERLRLQRRARALAGS